MTTLHHSSIISKRRGYISSPWPAMSSMSNELTDMFIDLLPDEDDSSQLKRK